MNAFLIRDNQIVARSEVSETGQFTFKNLAPGPYSFVASGLEGFSAFSIYTVIAGQVADGQAAGELLVPVAFQGVRFVMNGVLVSPEDVKFAIDQLLTAMGQNPEEAIAAAMPQVPAQFPGLGGTGGGFGGGAGGGGGLLPGILAGLIAAGVAAAVVDDDDGTTIIIGSPATLNSP